RPESDLPFKYERCLRGSNWSACQGLILNDELNPEQRANVRAQLSLETPDFIPRKLGYLLHDDEGYLASKDSLSKRVPMSQYKMCMVDENRYSCRGAMLHDQITAQQRADIRRQLERLDPWYIPRMIGYLSPSNVPVAPASPTPSPV